MKYSVRTIIILFLNIFLIKAVSAQNQYGNLEGHVQTTDGKPVIDASIFVKGYGSVLSDSTGYFKINNISAKVHSLQATLVGFKSNNITVVVKSNETTMVNIELNASQETLQEVIVQAKGKVVGTANSDDIGKMPLSNLENAQSYTTISKELLAQQLAINVNDALKNVPGVTQLWESVGRAGIGGAYYAQRGFVTQPKARNGVVGNVISDIDVSNIERVEVIKGPSATLFGNNITSYGGLINIVTKKPYQDFGGSVQYIGGGYGLSRFAVDINTPLDKEHKVLFRLNGAYNYQGTFQDFGYKKTYNISPSLYYKVNDRLSFQLDAEFQSSTSAGGSTIIYFLPPSSLKSTIQSFISAYPQAVQDQIMANYPKTAADAYGASSVDKINIDYKRSFYTNDLKNHLSMANFYGRIDYQLSTNWRSQTTISRNGNSSDGYMPFFYLIPNFIPSFISTGSFGTPGADYLARMIWKPVGNQNIVEAQQNFIGDFNIGKMRNRFVGGLDYYYNNYNMTYTYPNGKLFGIPYPYAFDVVPTTGYSPNYLNFNQNKVDSLFSASTMGSSSYPQRLMTYSAFANDVLNVTEQLLVSAGLRIDRFENKGVYSATTGETTGKYGQTALSPKFGLIYQVLKDRISIFGNYQNGFSNQTGTNFEGKSFKPEQANQWETGVKLALVQGKLSGTISYYDIKVKDIVRTDPDHPNFSIQDGTQVSKGFEADLSAQPIDGLSLTSGYSYNNSKYENANADIEGLRPVTAGPKNTVNFWGSYTLPKGDLKGLGFGFGANYYGESLVINSVSNGQFALPSYTLLNGTIYFSHPKFTISAKMNNIGNKHYWIGYTTMDAQMLRQFIASVSFKF